MFIELVERRLRAIPSAGAGSGVSQADVALLGRSTLLLPEGHEASKERHWQFGGRIQLSTRSHFSRFFLTHKDRTMVPRPLKLSSQEPKGYQLVQGEESPSDDDAPGAVPSSPVPPLPRRACHSIKAKNLIIGIISVLLVLAALNLTLAPEFPPHGHGHGGGGGGSKSGDGASPCDCESTPTTTVPQYFQTSPELWAGPTATGAPAFLAQTRTFDPTATFVPNAPLQTAVPVEGMGSANESIFQMMGYLSPYMPSPGFGVDEYPIPAGAEIVQVQMLSRHGARYPTSGTGSNVMVLGHKIADAKKETGFRATGPLEFLNEWEYQLGYEILVPKGRQELFDSGILHSYMYSSLYNPNSKIIVRTTTQDRMLKSAEYFMAGFFGLEWPNNATIEVIIEEHGFNNSLAGSKACPNAGKDNAGLNATYEWADVYLQKGESRSLASSRSPVCLDSPWC